MLQLQTRPSVPNYDGEFISSLDPLNGDGLLSHLPEMNASADVSAIVDAVRILLPTDSELATYSYEECLAAMRDLGILIGSIKRHGRQPVILVPELEPVLLELGRRTNMIPRDTVLHYCEWNPSGRRQRMYTGEQQEEILMNAVRLSLPPLSQAVELCKVFCYLSPTESAFPALLEAVAEKVCFLDQAITEVSKNVTPEFFAQVLRPYFEDIRVGNVDYLGPAAAQVPLFLVDLVVWASDYGDPAYDAFMDDGIKYTLPQWRTLGMAWEHDTSLVARVRAAFAVVQHNQAQQALQQTAQGLFRVLRQLVIFRGKHFGMARKAYSEGVGLYAHGSGGGSISLLRGIIDLTRQNANLCSRAYQVNKQEA